MNAGDTFASEAVVETVARAHASETWRWGYGCARIGNVNGQSIANVSFVPLRLDRLALGLSIVPHQATVMEHELLEELGGFQIKVGLAADQELLLRAALLSQPRLWGEFFADFERWWSWIHPCAQCERTRHGQIPQQPWTLRRGWPRTGQVSNNRFDGLQVG
jgi:hypothetical protein